MSIITYMETYQGVLRTSHPTLAKRQFETFLQTIPILPLSLSVAKRCMQLREDLRLAEKRVHGRARDLLTAVQALESKHPSWPLAPGKVQRREFESVRHGRRSFILSPEGPQRRLVPLG